MNKKYRSFISDKGYPEAFEFRDFKTLEEAKSWLKNIKTGIYYFPDGTSEPQLISRNLENKNE